MDREPAPVGQTEPRQRACDTPARLRRCKAKLAVGPGRSGHRSKSPTPRSPSRSETSAGSGMVTAGRPGGRAGMLAQRSTRWPEATAGPSSRSRHDAAKAPAANIKSVRSADADLQGRPFGQPLVGLQPSPRSKRRWRTCDSHATNSQGLRRRTMALNDRPHYDAEGASGTARSSTTITSSAKKSSISIRQRVTFTTTRATSCSIQNMRRSSEKGHPPTRRRHGVKC
jgi:hypothetical protein